MSALFLLDLTLPTDLVHSFGVSLSSPYYTWLSYAYFHLNFLHLLFNMFVFVMVGVAVERHISKQSYWIFTLCAALFCGWPAVYLPYEFGGKLIRLIGFSGVVFAFIGLALYREISAQKGIAVPLFHYVMRNPPLVVFLILPFLTDSGISGEAHLLGLVFGVLSARFFLLKTKTAPKGG